MRTVENPDSPGRYTSLIRFLAVFAFLFLTGATPLLAQTFTTIADGNWSSAGTWSGGTVPTTSGNFPSTYIINIRHTVDWNSSNSINNDGVVRIEPIVGTTARLNLPTNVNVENTGEWYIINAALIQFRFVGGGDSGTPQSGTFKNKGGLVDVQNSIVEIAQDWTNEKDAEGAVRTFVNSCLITGQNFSNTDSFDTLIGSTVSIGWHGSGSFQYSDVEFEFQDVRIQLAGTSGNFELNKGLAFGDIDYITLKNHVTGNVGSGKISASSSLDTTPGLNLDAFCAATYESNGKFSGTQTSEPRPACPLTDVYFPCVPGTVDEPQLTLVKVVTNNNGGNAATNDFDLNLQGNDGVHNAGVDYQDSGSGVLPTVTDGVEYTVSETPLDGYTLDSIVCDDDDIGGTTDIGTTFTLDPGQNVTCTFTNNDIAPTLTLTKVVINDSAGGPDLGPDDFGISVGGVGVTSGATNPYDANTPLAIDESLPAGYSFVSITGDAKCPLALGGTVTLDEGEDVSCTITNDDIAQTEGPNIDLAKAVVSGPTFDTSTNRWTVVYSVSATNLGDEPGSYDLVDTLTPATGISVFAAELTSYDAGSENSQTGTILGDGATPEAFNSGDTLVDGEGLGAGENESWTITVEFEVDLSLIDEGAYACIQGDESEGDGFYNLATGVNDEANLDNNDACVNLPEWAINLSKTVSSVTLLDADTFQVVYGIQAENTGATFGLYDLVDSLDPGTGITLVSVELTAYVAGTENSQTGTLAGALPHAFNSGDTLVTNEALAAGLSESWSITAVFDVDWADVELEIECSEVEFGAGTGFYNFVSGNIDENTDDNHACGEPTPPDLAVTKDAAAPVGNPDGSYSVSYTILVQNSGQRPASYDLDDTLLTDDSVTLAAIDQGLTYNAGASNDLWVPPQDGTIETVTVLDLQSGTTTLLSGETLAGESDETWTIVLRFEVDSALLTTEGANCVLETSENGTGFLNRVEVVVGEQTVAQDDGCTGIPQDDRARFRVIKDFTDDNPLGVEVFISCNTGLPLDQSKVITEGEADAVTFVVVDFDSGEMDCDVFETVPNGYAPTYAASAGPDGVAGAIGDDAEGCHYDAVAGGLFICEITNAPQPVEVEIIKDWVFEGSSVASSIDTRYELTLFCDAEIVDGFPIGIGQEAPQGDLLICGFLLAQEGPQGNGIFPDWCKAFSGEGPDTFFAEVIPEWPDSHCFVIERLFDDAVEVDNGCLDIVVSAGQGASCTITNTVFFEGIPTLNQYGLALLALLMLGVGFVGFRRFA
jgi:hypothetical protein